MYIHTSIFTGQTHNSCAACCRGMRYGCRCLNIYIYIHMQTYIHMYKYATLTMKSSKEIHGALH